MRNITSVGQSLPGPFTAALTQRGCVFGPGGVEILHSAAKPDAIARRRSGEPWLWLVREPCPPDLAAQAIAYSAYDVICLSDPDAAAQVVARLDELSTPPPEAPAGGPFVAVSEPAKRLRSQLAMAARTSMPVLLTGETGAGKEIAARLLHEWSSRRDARFVPINCGAIPNELMEAELFGYSKGAFTGAGHRFDGQLMAAEGGTVFLDEIDDTPYSTQVKLLRVLEDRVVTRIGESDPHRVDFRILAATNRDLKPLIASGQFGADFYERLAIVSIHLPALRERVEDIHSLAQFFIERFYREEPERSQRVQRVSPIALRALEAYPWPGNIRELRNVVFEALVYKRAGETLLLSDLPRRVLEKPAAASFDSTVATRIDSGKFNLRVEVEALERAALQHALRKTGGNAAAAAKMLGEVGRGSASDPGSTVRAMMRRLGISAGSAER